MRLIRIHRARVREDMLEIFSDPTILSSQLSATIVDSQGNAEKGAGTGVLREIFSMFWKDLNDSLLVGENERVPYIRHDYDKCKWEVVGRILVKGFLEVSYFPTSLSKVFLSSCLFGESLVTEYMLLESFKAYVSGF